MIAYDTLLDLAAQRAEAIAGSRNHTRGARSQAAAMGREIREELAAFNVGCPLRRLQDTGFVTDGYNPDHLAFSAATRNVLMDEADYYAAGHAIAA